MTTEARPLFVRCEYALHGLDLCWCVSALSFPLLQTLSELKRW